MLSLLSSRNNCIHSDQPGLQNRQEAETLARVQQLYDKAEQLPADDREMLDIPISDRLTQPIETLKHWLEITSKTVDNSIQAYRVRLRQRHTPINDIFPQRQANNDGSVAPHNPPPIQARTSPRLPNIRNIIPRRPVSVRTKRHRNTNTTSTTVAMDPSVARPKTKERAPVFRRIVTRSQSHSATTSIPHPPSTVLLTQSVFPKARAPFFRRIFTRSQSHSATTAIPTSPSTVLLTPSVSPSPPSIPATGSSVFPYSIVTRSRSTISPRSSEATPDQFIQHQYSQDSLSSHRK